MSDARDELVNELHEGRGVYHMWKGRSPFTDGEWFLMRQGNEKATARGTRAEVRGKANSLLDDPGIGGTGALLVVEWEIVPIRGGHESHRIRRVYVGEHMSAGRMAINEEKVRR